MKIYARQINPEYQESPLFMGDEFFPDNIAVCGNRDYHSHKPELFENVQNVLEQGGACKGAGIPERVGGLVQKRNGSYKRLFAPGKRQEVQH